MKPFDALSESSLRASGLSKVNESELNSIGSASINRGRSARDITKDIQTQALKVGEGYWFKIVQNSCNFINVDIDKTLQVGNRLQKAQVTLNTEINLLKKIDNKGDIEAAKFLIKFLTNRANLVEAAAERGEDLANAVPRFSEELIVLKKGQEGFTLRDFWFLIEVQYNKLLNQKLNELQDAKNSVNLSQAPIGGEMGLITPTTLKEREESIKELKQNKNKVEKQLNEQSGL